MEYKWLSDENDTTSKLARLMVFVKMDYEGNPVTLQSERIKMLAKIEQSTQDQSLRQNIEKEHKRADITAQEINNFSLISSTIAPSFERSVSVAQANLEQRAENIKNDELEQKERDILEKINNILKPVFWC